MYPVVIIILLLATGNTATPFYPSYQLREAISSTPPILPTITDITWSGNGCPQNNSPVTLNSAFTFPYFRIPSAFEASVPGSAVDKTKNCQAHLHATGATPGWQVALRDVWVKGHLVLEKGVTLGTYLTVYFSQDAAETATAQQTVVGEGNRTGGEVTLRSHIPADSLVWSPCADAKGSLGILNINFRIALTSSDASAHGYFGNSVNSTVTERLAWEWRRC